MEKSEKETTINWSYADDTAIIYTFDVALINKIKRGGGVPIREGVYEQSQWAEFELNKRWIKVSKPVVRNDLRKNAVMSE